MAETSQYNKTKGIKVTMNNELINDIIKRRNLCQVDIDKVKYQVNKQKVVDVNDQRSIQRKQRFERDVAFLRGKIDAYNETVTILKQGDSND